MDLLSLVQDWLLDHWQQEVTTIQNAPVAFLVLMALCAFGWRLVFGHRFNSYDIRAEAQRALIARLESDVAEYKDRLNGASPDEVRAKIEALEAKIAQLDKPKAKPREISAAQQFALISANQVSKVGVVWVTCDSTDGETIRFTNRLSEALGDAGIHAVRGPDSVSEEDEFGIVVRVDDIDNPSPFGRSLIEFFRLSGLDYTVRKSPRPTNPDIYIMVAPQMVPPKEGAGS